MMFKATFFFYLLPNVFGMDSPPGRPRSDSETSMKAFGEVAHKKQVVGAGVRQHVEDMITFKFPDGNELFASKQELMESSEKFDTQFSSGVGTDVVQVDHCPYAYNIFLDFLQTRMFVPPSDLSAEEKTHLFRNILDITREHLTGSVSLVSHLHEEVEKELISLLNADNFQKVKLHYKTIV